MIDLTFARLHVLRTTRTKVVRRLEPYLPVSQWTVVVNAINRAHEGAAWQATGTPSLRALQGW